MIGVFDTETTGIDTEHDRIVTAHVGTIDERTGEPINGQTWLIDPQVPIPDEATAVHGITTDHARMHGIAAPTGIRDIYLALMTLERSGVPITVYNAPFDLTLLDREVGRHLGEHLHLPNLQVIDPLVLDKAHDTYRRGSRRLADVAALYGVPNEGAHGAEADAVMAGRVALKIINANDALRGGTPADIHRWSIQWRARQQASFRQYLEGQGKPTEDVVDDWPMIPRGTR